MQQVNELDLERKLKLLYLVAVAIVKLGTSDIRARSSCEGARSTRDFSKQVCRESDQSYIDPVTMISFSGVCSRPDTDKHRTQKFQNASRSHSVMLAKSTKSWLKS